MNILTKLIRQNKSRFRLEDDIQDADINELIAETLSERFCPHEISISGEGADEEIHLNSCPGSEENGECKQCQL